MGLPERYNSYPPQDSEIKRIIEEFTERDYVRHIGKVRQKIAEHR